MPYHIILPHQLFDIKTLSKSINKETKIILWEHPHYFTSYNYNKKNLFYIEHQ